MNSKSGRGNISFASLSKAYACPTLKESAIMSKDPSKMPEYPGEGVDTKPGVKKMFYEEGVNFKQFLWNPVTKAFLGRNAESWGKILAFYVVFYAFLAGFFAFMMTVFYHTLEEDRPKYTSKGGESILKAPGLSMRPDYRPDVRYQYLIEYNPGDPTTYAELTASINRLIKTYEDTKTTAHKDCSSTFDGKGVCDFDLSTLGRNLAVDTWGYGASTPTVILKPNKVFDWIPQPCNRNATALPDELKNSILNKNITTEMIWVWCTSVKGVDFTYSPQPGFPVYYYPFKNQKGYLSPLVAVSIKGLPKNEKVKVVCSAYAENLKDTSLRFNFIVKNVAP